MRTTPELLAERLDRTRAAMAERGVESLVVSLGADMPWLTGYHPMPLERLTALVIPAEGRAELLVPRLEAPLVDHHEEVFDLRPWDETENPVDLVLAKIGSATRVAIGDRMWAGFLVDMYRARPDLRTIRASEVVSPLRSVKDPAEVEALRTAARAADRVIHRLRDGETRLVGRTEADVSADLANQLLDEGHEAVNFTIVASGPNAASPHHHAGDKVISEGEIVLFDIGGVLDGYCSDITRCVHLGRPPAELTELYDVLEAAQARSVASAVVGEECENVDAAARDHIAAAGMGEYFIHRTGHGIGLEAHEDPYIVAGNHTVLLPGHAFSIEPGIYVPGRWGARLEDIVVATEDGPDTMNDVPHGLAVVEV